jgi:hypothetical protein
VTVIRSPRFSRRWPCSINHYAPRMIFAAFLDLGVQQLAREFRFLPQCNAIQFKILYLNSATLSEVIALYAFPQREPER